MNKKILEIPFVLMSVAMLIAPVLAAPATKIEGVTLTTATNLHPISSGTSIHNNIVHNEGTVDGTATLKISEQSSLHFDYEGTWSGTSKWTGFPDPDSEGSNVVNSMVVLTCTDGDKDGTFEGTLHTKNIGLPPVLPPNGPWSYTETHMVLHGTGDFQGWTLKVSYAGEPPTDLEGTLIRPK